MLANVEWGEFRIGDLFEVDNWVYGKNKNYVSYSLQKSIGSTPVVSGITENNGVSYYTNDHLKEDEIFEPNLTISTRGEYSGTVFYQKNKFALANNVLVMKMLEFSPNQKKFIGAIINSLSYGGYSNYPKKNTLKENIIQLPIKNGEIDFDFMETFIEKLEKERIGKVNAYLTISGLKDYHLTDEETTVLENFENDEVQWGEYNLEKLFGNASRGRRLKSADRIKGELPFVTAGEANEGISAFIGNDVRVFSENTITIDMFGSAKYRNYKYGGDDHVAIVHTENINHSATVFITSAIHKTSYNGQFNYGRNFYPKDADVLNIKLPTINNEPDYKTMELLISALKKQIIKGVVTYTKEKLN